MANAGTALSRRDRKKERTRGEIYDAAMRLFASRSFTDVTIAEICDAADVGRGTFFQHASPCIIAIFARSAMEAERVNAISKQLQNIEGRVAELRRYL
jgi:hypothetical protein